MPQADAVVHSAEADRYRSRRWRSVWLLIGAGLLLIALWLGLKAWRIAGAVNSLQAQRIAAEQMLDGGLTNLDVERAEAILLDVRSDVKVIRNETAAFVPLLRFLEWLPRIGPTLAASPQLLAMADAGTESAAYAFRGLKPALILLQEDGAMAGDGMGQILATIEEAEPDLEQARFWLARFAEARKTLDDAEGLPEPLVSALTRIDALLPLAEEGLVAAPMLPELLGLGSARSYLIIAQNEDELRPTGGFISGVGKLVVQDGRVIDLSFQDAYAVDDWRNKPYDLPPQPLYDFMGLELFLFRDANFWPDFPTSAEQAIKLYSYGQGISDLDGAIAIDQQFVRLLLQGTGPVVLPDTGKIDSRNVLDHMRDAWGEQEDLSAREWIRTRKSFMGPLAAAIMDKITSGSAPVDPIGLASALSEAIATRHLQIYVRDPELAGTLSRLGWDGRLPDPEQDFLLVVDTNVSYNKVNLLVDTGLSYDVVLDENGRARSDLTITYEHRGIDSGEPCYQGTIDAYVEGVEYLVLTDDCYWNYLRVYVPASTELREASSHRVPGTAMINGKGWTGQAEASSEIPGLATVANFLMVPQSSTVSSSYHFVLPPEIVRQIDDFSRYRLEVHHQAGARPRNLEVSVTLPLGTKVVAVRPEPTKTDGRTLIFQSRLATNLIFEIDYR